MSLNWFSVQLSLVQFGSTDSEESKSASPTDSATDDTGSKYKELVVTLENGVQTIRMNRPDKYNAITWEVECNSINNKYSY